MYELVKLALTPSTVYLSKGAAFQIILLVPRQAVPGIRDLVMPKADRRQVGLNSARGQSFLLHIGYVGGKVFAGNVGELLQPVLLCHKFQKSLVGFKVAFSGFEAALSVVSEQLLSLLIKRLIIADSITSIFHIGMASPVTLRLRFRPVSASAHLKNAGFISIYRFLNNSVSIIPRRYAVVISFSKYSAWT